MRKVLHILACGKSGGIETLLSGYAGKSRQENHFVFVWEKGYYEEKIKEQGCDTYFLDANKNGFLGSAKKLLELIADIQPEIIVTHHGSPMIRVFVTLLRLRYHNKIPVLMYVHCDARDELTGRNKLFRQIVNIAAAKSAVRVVAISQYVKKSIIQNFKAKPEKIEVIYNGVDISQFANRNAAAHTPVRLVFIGRLVEVKGVQIALQALKICIEERRALSFSIVGQGAYQNRLEKMAQELGIAQYCVFMGARRDIPEILVESDIFIHPCVWEEGFGIGIVEAMAAGKICICSRSGAIPEIITDGVDGYLVEKGNPKALADAIMLAIKNKDGWSGIQDRAAQTACLFSMERFVSRLDDLIEEIANE